MAPPLALVSALVALAAAVPSSRGCFVPPTGCQKQVCNSFNAFPLPVDGNWDSQATWNGPGNSKMFRKLAFYKSHANEWLVQNTSNVGKFSAARWLSLKNGFKGDAPGLGTTQGPPVTPSLNYEWYKFEPGRYTPAPAGASASLAACCNACRLSPTCPLYFYVPPAGLKGGQSTNGGTCYFVSGGSFLGDGPYDWVDPKNPKSPRTVNLGVPPALKQGVNGAPGYQLTFLGGYCNNHEYSPGNVTDDPHFTGAHGTRYDFNGELDKAFCLVTDKSVHLNAVLKGYKNDNTVGATVGSDGKAIRSWIREIGLMWTSDDGEMHTLHMVARSGKEMARGLGFLESVHFDGTPVAVPAEAGNSWQGGDMRLTFLGTAKKGWYDVDQFRVTVGNQLNLGLHMRVAHPKLQSKDDAEAHFNLVFNDIKVTDAVHGVLGQTYRNTPEQMMKAVKYSELSRLLGAPIKADGESGAGFLEGSMKDYMASHVLKPDCKVSTFSK